MIEITELQITPETRKFLEEMERRNEEFERWMDAILCANELMKDNGAKRN